MVKICERFVADWLMKSIIDQIDERQYSSLKRSTTHVLFSFFYYLLNRSDEPKNFIRIFLLDFAKDFDYIEHNTLLRKLSSMSVPQIIINWITNFLTERVQRVKIGPCISGWQKRNGGVPQARHCFRSNLVFGCD